MSHGDLVTCHIEHVTWSPPNMSCRVNPHVATTAIWRLINTLRVKNISIQIESSNLLTFYPSVNSKMILEVCACLARGYMGNEKGVWPRQ